MFSSLVLAWLWTALGVSVGVTYALILMLAGTGFMFHLARKHTNRPASQ